MNIVLRHLNERNVSPTPEMIHTFDDELPEERCLWASLISSDLAYVATMARIVAIVEDFIVCITCV